MIANPMDLTGKRILVTGASSGIGRATAILLSRLGAALALVARNTTRLDETLAALEGDAHARYSYDLADADGIPKLMADIAADGGPLAGLFHAAGTVTVQPVTILKQKHLDSIFESSVNAALLLARGFCQAAVGSEGGTSLVFMSSVAAQRGQAGMSAYSASKAAVDGAVRSLACELAARGIRVNGIAAGAVKTEMHESIVGKLGADGVANYERKHLLGFGSPDDIACAAAFLLSDAAKWITGTVMTVDGGYCCQ